MNRPTLILLALLSLTGMGCRKDCTRRDLTAKAVYYYVLAGQSNMSAESQMPKFTAHPAIEFHALLGQPTAGPGYQYAIRRATEEPTSKFVLIQCSIGGTTSDQWVNGLAQSCLATVQKVLPPGAVVDALFYQQGENDTANPDAQWDVNFTGIVSLFRSTLGQPDLPVIYGRLGDRNPGWNMTPVSWERVKDQQASISLNNVFAVSAEGLPYDAPDSMHYSYDGYVALGNRYYDADLSMIRRVDACRDRLLGF